MIDPFEQPNRKRQREKISVKKRKLLQTMIATGAVLAATPFSSFAADSSGASANHVEKTALYEGPNRQQQLIDAAKKEGTLNLYTSVPVSNMEKLTTAFQAKYGIPVTAWRAGSNQVSNRLITEYRGKKFTVDTVVAASAQLEALSHEKILQKINSPYFSKLMQDAVPSHHEWAPVYLSTFVQVYNTNLVRKEDLPHTYAQLLDPKWKGKMAVESTDVDWFFGIISQMGESQGLQYFKDLSANELSVRTGHTLLAKMVAMGEVPYALTVYSYMARQLKHEGAPLDWYAIQPAIARTNGIGVVKNSPHPNAAVLFHDFILSDGQKILAEIFYDPANKDYQSEQNNFPVKIINDQAIIKGYEKYQKL